MREPNHEETVLFCLAMSKLNASLSKLHQEHDAIGDAVRAIRKLTKKYANPDDACNTYVVTYRKLREFEDDLHKHVQNILFPRAAPL